MQYVNEMIAAMKSDGLLVNNLIFDDLVHRVPTIAKPNQKDGYYVAFSGGSSVYYGNWITGVEKAHSFQTNVTARDNSLALRAARAAYKEAQLKKQLASAKQCRTQWENARAVLTHPYLVIKQINPYSIRVDKHNNLLVPIMDEQGELINLQYIFPQGDKRFNTGGRVKGGALQLGTLTEQTTLLVCEGYATGCSLHEATGLPVVVAFNAGNLESVCIRVKQLNPRLRIILCADNDHQTKVKTGHNIGLEKAQSIADKTNVQVLWPNFESNNSGSDFNDIHCQFGLETLRSMLLSAINVGAK
ncbi:toprim domain-containing protein [Colwellia sp. Arc7-D]|uniref:toprim domain-containing protein n=1 Tax=Colwellia sp. Arc7-D TaxID=2161872 RepID=UPI000D36E4F3|nr:toprim domain-containing protein [Colwellia sp. Arc7-D]AWB58208.1 hypothetical protein DBO93_11945 [Colwellia sp. Arc7-D]